MVATPLSRRAMLGLAVSTLAGRAFAQAFPTKPVKLVVGFAPGGGSDFVARAVTSSLGSELGQQVIVENRAGAGGGIAARYVASADADGYTLLLGSAANFVINPLLVKTLPYEVSAFVPVSPLARFSYALLVRKTLPVSSVAELVAYAAQRPEGLTIGSAGNGSNTHLVAATLMASTGIRLRHVPYKGTTPALTDLMGGVIDVLFDSIPTVHDKIRGGSLRALAVTGPEREALLPEVPTMAELGWKTFVASNWFAVFAPKRTPPEVVGRLNAAIQKTLANERVRKTYVESGNTPLAGSAADLERLVASETAAYRGLIQATGITAD